LKFAAFLSEVSGQPSVVSSKRTGIVNVPAADQELLTTGSNA
jgi:hypothetical protein